MNQTSTECISVQQEHFLVSHTSRTPEIIFDDIKQNKITGLDWNETNRDVFIALVVLNLLYHGIRNSTDKSPKRSSWILTLICSFVGIVGCFTVIYNLIEKGWTTNFIYSCDRLSCFFIRFFCVFFILDLVYLSLHYPKESGWSHHIAYFLCMSCSLVYSFPMVFVVFFPLEVPTFILAVGHIWPQHRQDILFGFTFFCTRVLFHGFMLRILYDTRDISPLPVWQLAILSWCIHVGWFSKWCVSQYKRSFRKLKL